MSPDPITEARRQIEICNACRYCEGYCDVFPEIHAQRTWSDGDITHLANLCHNCRGCYYACQYTAPHEFGLNLPGILTQVRHDSWISHAWPRGLARLFQRSGVALAGTLTLTFALFFRLATALRPETGEGFYALMSHGLMVATFAPAFLLPLIAIAISLSTYWHEAGGTLSLRGAISGARRAGTLKNLAGGHGEGCNFEDEDRFSNTRRRAHQAVVYGFLLSFAATVSGTILHYGFDLPAPYGLFSLPKLLGLPGGLLLCLGTFELARLKLKANPDLGAPQHWNGEMAFVLLLFAISATGLALYAATGTTWVSLLLPLHLGSVLTFFLTMPYTKMVHGFYRLAALTASGTRHSSFNIHGSLGS